MSDVATGELVVNGPAVESTFAAGQNRTLTFTATAGQSLKVSVPVRTTSTTALSVTAPDGTKPVNDTSVSVGETYLLSAVQAGVYKILINPSGTTTGVVSIQVQTQ